MSRKSSIEERLRAALDPTFLDVVNESSMHSVPPGSETHFRVVVVSAAFVGKSRVERHRAVQKALGEEFGAGLHALTIAPYTPDEWAESPEPARSPACLGGSKADR